MRRSLWIGLTAVLVGSLVIGSWPGDRASNATPDRVDRLASQLRCPTCEGLSVADSDSPLSRSSREEISRQVIEGRSDAEIRQFFVDRYGPEALIVPPREGIGTVAFVLPMLGVAVAVASVIFGIRRWRSNPSASTPTSTDRQLVEEALGGGQR